VTSNFHQKILYSGLPLIIVWDLQRTKHKSQQRSIEAKDFTTGAMACLDPVTFFWTAADTLAFGPDLEIP